MNERDSTVKKTRRIRIKLDIVFEVDPIVEPFDSLPFNAYDVMEDTVCHCGQIIADNVSNTQGQLVGVTILPHGRMSASLDYRPTKTRKNGSVKQKKGKTNV